MDDRVTPPFTCPTCGQATSEQADAGKFDSFRDALDRYETQLKFGQRAAVRDTVRRLAAARIPQSPPMQRAFLLRPLVRVYRMIAANHRGGLS